MVGFELKFSSCVPVDFPLRDVTVKVGAVRLDDVCHVKLKSSFGQVGL